MELLYIFEVLLAVSFTEQIEIESEEKGLTELKNRVDYLESTITTLKAIASEAVEQADDAKEKASHAEQLAETYNHRLGPVVAFTALMTEGIYRPWNNVTPLPFKHVLTNVGNAYDSSSSTFICPVTGLYSFGFSLHSSSLRAGSDADRSNAYLYNVNQGKKLVMVDTASVISENLSGQGSTSIAIWCQAQHKIQVRPYDTNKNQFYSTIGYPTGVFTGHLIRPSQA